MKILVVGKEQSFTEVKSKWNDQFDLVHSFNFHNTIKITEYDYIFDFSIDEAPEIIEQYAQLNDTIIFINTVKITLSELRFTYGEWTNEIYGFNGLPTFFNRPILEISSFNGKYSDHISSELNTEIILVDDRIGLVTPRIILMIINEAFFTVQEGTASKGDIDLGMKLGTNYPYGPFEWCKKIGLQNVFETLEAIFDDTKDERYKIAPLLKKEYLQS
jgi:3-hydroxybutyryl-CoA dehydrogenase